MMLSLCVRVGALVIVSGAACAPALAGSLSEPNFKISFDAREEPPLRTLSDPPPPPGCASATFLYAALWGGDLPPTVAVHCVNADGTLTLIAEQTVPSDVRDLLGRDGGPLYYASDDLLTYELLPTGLLSTPPKVHEVGWGTFDDVTLHPGAGELYATHSMDGGKVLVYDVQSDPAEPSLLQTVEGFYLPGGIQVDNDGDHVHVANYSPGEIVTFGLLADGRLDLGDFSVTGFDARAKYFALHPSLARLYWTETVGGSVLTGGLVGGDVQFEAASFSGFGARPLVIDQTGTKLYVANNNDDDITIFSVTAGALSFDASVATERRPEHVILHPDGTHLYVASAGDLGGPSHITVYTVLAGGSLVGLDTVAFPRYGLYRLEILRLAP